MELSFHLLDKQIQMSGIVASYWSNAAESWSLVGWIAVLLSKRWVAEGSRGVEFRNLVAFKKLSANEQSSWLDKLVLDLRVDFRND